MTVEYLLPQAFKPEQLAGLSPLKPYSEEALAFVENLSLLLMRSPAARSYPELTALAFWMRRANLEKLRIHMKKRAGDALLTPRGTVFHIAPSNVDTIFVYSWFLSLLVGNRNIVRLSGKDSIQTNILLAAIRDLVSSPEHGSIAKRNILIKYEANDEITKRLSSICDVRTIWGGDATVQKIRQIAVPPTALDIAFANKYSIAIIEAKSWFGSSTDQKQKWAEAFYNDSYWFDQMACSSPRLVLWFGNDDDAKEASTDFWEYVKSIFIAKHERFDDADYVNKLVATNNLAVAAEVSIQPTEDNGLLRVWLDKPDLYIEHNCGAGLFFEGCLSEFHQFYPLLTRSVQTVTYAGFTKNQLYSYIEKTPVSGIDRIVPFGQALDFSPVWDGYDLPRIFMREITIS